MGISDAYIDVTCDQCHAEERWEPEYKFTDYSGETGYYDTTDSAFDDWCNDTGWAKKVAGEEYVICSDCLPL